MPWIEQAVLATLWSYVTFLRWPAGPANMMGADVRLPYVKGESGKTYLKDVRDPDELARGLMEVLKYPNKVAQFADCPDESVQLAGYKAWFFASARRRLRQATGAWYEWDELLQELEEDPDEDAPAEDLSEKVCVCCGVVGDWRRIGVPDPCAVKRAERGGFVHRAPREKLRL